MKYVEFMRVFKDEKHFALQFYILTLYGPN